MLCRCNAASTHGALVLSARLRTCILSISIGSTHSEALHWSRLCLSPAWSPCPSALTAFLGSFRFLVSLAAGALLGTAFGHLLPESIERVGSGRELAGLLLAGFVTFFVLEKFLGVWCNRCGGDHRHSHSATAIFIHMETLLKLPSSIEPAVAR